MPHKRKRGGREERMKKVHNTSGKDTCRADGLWREQTHGTIGSGDVHKIQKRRQGTILVWFSYNAVSSFIER